MNALVQPIATAAVGGGSDDLDDVGVVRRLIEAYISSLENACLLNYIFIGLWGESCTIVAIKRFGTTADPFVRTFSGLVVLGGLLTLLLSARLEHQDRRRFESGTYVTPSSSFTPIWLRWCATLPRRFH